LDILKIINYEIPKSPKAIKIVIFILKLIMKVRVMKNKLKPINSTKKISTQIRNNSKTEIILTKKNANATLSNDFLPVE